MLLARAPLLAADIAYLLGTPDWQSHPIFLELQTATPAPLDDYVSRIRALSASDASAPLLLAHAYVRYLGDLSGGQIIKRRLMKVYDLPETGKGVRFYEFESASGDGSKAGQPEIGQLKDWYRGGMDAGVGEDEKLKGE
jgi:heme oxygenase